MSQVEQLDRMSEAELRVASARTLLRDRHHTRLGQYYRDLAYRICLLTDATVESPLAVGVTSCARRAGVSTVAANLAMALAQSAKGTCLLVDAHPRHASLHTRFGVPRSPGFLDIIDRANDVPDCVFQVAEVPKLYFMPAGDVRVVGPKVIAEGLNHLKNHFNFVVLDLPPANEPNDGLALASATDANLLVLQAERVRRHVAHRTRQRLEDAGAVILGTVFNKRRHYIPGWIYRNL